MILSQWSDDVIHSDRSYQVTPGIFMDSISAFMVEFSSYRIYAVVKVISASKYPEELASRVLKIVMDYPNIKSST